MLRTNANDHLTPGSGGLPRYLFSCSSSDLHSGRAVFSSTHLDQGTAILPSQQVPAKEVHRRAAYEARHKQVRGHS